MTQAPEMSANEVEALVLKAGRGGGLALGYAEDLSAATAYLDLAALTQCPCHAGAAQALPAALDLVAAGEGPQTVTADAALIAAYVAVAQQQYGRLTWNPTPTGAEFIAFDANTAPTSTPERMGRRVLSPDLLAHLTDLYQKILVPETEASRAAGAGAGLNDND